MAPDAVRYLRRFLPLGEVQADNLRRWVGELDTLAAEIDALGPSTDGREATRMETWARTRRDRHLNRILLGLGCFMLLVWVALFVFGWLFIGQ